MLLLGRRLDGLLCLRRCRLEAAIEELLGVRDRLRVELVWSRLRLRWIGASRVLVLLLLGRRVLSDVCSSQYIVVSS